MFSSARGILRIRNLGLRACGPAPHPVGDDARCLLGLVALRHAELQIKPGLLRQPREATYDSPVALHNLRRRGVLILGVRVGSRCVQIRSNCPPTQNRAGVIKAAPPRTPSPRVASTSSRISTMAAFNRNRPLTSSCSPDVDVHGSPGAPAATSHTVVTTLWPDHRRQTFFELHFLPCPLGSRETHLQACLRGTTRLRGASAFSILSLECISKKATFAEFRIACFRPICGSGPSSHKAVRLEPPELH